MAPKVFQYALLTLLLEASSLDAQGIPGIPAIPGIPSGIPGIPSGIPGVPSIPGVPGTGTGTPSIPTPGIPAPVIPTPGVPAPKDPVPVPTPGVPAPKDPVPVPTPGFPTPGGDPYDPTGVIDVGENATITDRSVTYSVTPCLPRMLCSREQKCKDDTTFATLSADRKMFSCCPAKMKLLNSRDGKSWSCCQAGYEVAGNSASGYHCCPSGNVYTGTTCHPCPGGAPAVDNKCGCPPGQTQGPDGSCSCPEGEVLGADGRCGPPHPPPGKCSSGLKSGHCYIFGAENGNKLGLRNDGVYYAAPDSMIQRYGKFQLCADEKCTVGRLINPDTTIYIKDKYGDLGTGDHNGQWLNNAANGNHIGRTVTFANAGQFALSKWPCGKYCLGGATQGIGPACPQEIPAMTFYPKDPQMCLVFNLTEVPCDIKSPGNNCVWSRSGDQCCPGPCTPKSNDEL